MIYPLVQISTLSANSSNTAQVMKILNGLTGYGLLKFALISRIPCVRMNLYGSNTIANLSVDHNLGFQRPSCEHTGLGDAGSRKPQTLERRCHTHASTRAVQRLSVWLRTLVPVKRHQTFHDTSQSTSVSISSRIVMQQLHSHSALMATPLQHNDRVLTTSLILFRPSGFIQHNDYDFIVLASTQC